MIIDGIMLFDWDLAVDMTHALRRSFASCLWGIAGGNIFA